jgi:hypothetical protein
MDMSFNLGNALKSIAPTIATMLGGPLAGGAVTALEGVFGLAPGSGTAAIANVLQTGALTPEMIEKLKEVELTQATLMSQQKIDLVRLNLDHDAALAADDVADRSSARAMAVATRDWTPSVLAWGIIGANLVLIWALAAGKIESKDPALFGLVGTALGYLVSESKAVLAYYFGSSVGSKDKDATLAEIAKQ